MSDQESFIYNMKLHESFQVKTGGCSPIGELTVTRVPGGWIYTDYRLDRDTMSSVFIPFNNDMQVKTEDVEFAV